LVMHLKLKFPGPSIKWTDYDLGYKLIYVRTKENFKITYKDKGDRIVYDLHDVVGLYYPK